MNWLQQVLDPALLRALGWMLIHSIWQGAVVALALAVLLLVLRRQSAQARYATAATALVVLLTLALVTFGQCYYRAITAAETERVATAGSPAYTSAAVGEPAAETTPAVLAPEPAASVAATGLQRWFEYFEQNIPVLVLAWLLGLLAMTLRLLGGLAYVQRLRHYRTEPVGEQWQRRLAALAARAGLRRSVGLLESCLVRAPLVVGHLRPVILLPLGTVTGLSQPYLEAVLAHELAHVARRDYLINLAQSVVEILFFYHPAAWFISACLRAERENCCDDVATALVDGNPLTVARALAALAELGVAPAPVPRLAMSALGPDGSLLGRIRRLVQGRDTPTFSEGFWAACVVLVGVGVLFGSMVVSLNAVAGKHIGQASASEMTAMPPDELSADVTAALDTTMPESLSDDTVVVYSQLNPKLQAKSGRARLDEVKGLTVVMKDETGEIANVYVDGKKVPATELATYKAALAKREEAARQPTTREAARSKRMEELGQLISLHALTGDTTNGSELAELSALALETAGEAMRTMPADVRREVAQAQREASRERQQALREAEQERQQALREAQQERREAERERQRALQEADRERQQALREADRERQQALREAEQERNAALREAEQERRAAQREAAEERREEVSSRIVAALRQDGLVGSSDNYQFRITPTSLVVNGKTQSASAHKKYLALYQQVSGRTLSGTQAYAVARSSSGMTFSDSNTRPPAAPAVPAMPAVPAAPAAPSVPAAPAAPAAPAVSTDQLRQQLRQDGLIDKNAKGFQFQLNDAGLTVNGEAQSAALAEKYRKLYGATGQGNTANRKSSRTISVSVSE